MLTGVVPPDAPGRLAEDELVYPSQLEPSISLQVSDVIVKALAMDPSKRPQTAQEFQRLLIAAVEGAEEQLTAQGADQQLNTAVLSADGDQTGTERSPGQMTSLSEHMASGGESQAIPEAAPVSAAGAAAGPTAAVLAGRSLGDAAEAIPQLPSGVPSEQLPDFPAADGLDQGEATPPQTLKERILSNRRIWLPGLLVAVGVCILIVVFAFPDRQRAGVQPQQMAPVQQQTEAAVKENPPPNIPENTAIPAAGSGGGGNNPQPVYSSGDDDEDYNPPSGSANKPAQDYKKTRTKSKSSGEGTIHFVEPKKPKVTPGVTMDRNLDP